MVSFISEFLLIVGAFEIKFKGLFKDIVTVVHVNFQYGLPQNFCISNILYTFKTCTLATNSQLYYFHQLRLTYRTRAIK